MHIMLQLRGNKNMNNELFFDCILLNEINKNPNVSFDKLSSLLKCSKTIIINRIELLLKEKLLYVTTEGFFLTKSGQLKKIDSTPYNKVSIPTLNTQDTSKSSSFKWDIDYIPDESSFE